MREALLANGRPSGEQYNFYNCGQCGRHSRGALLDKPVALENVWIC